MGNTTVDQMIEDARRLSPDELLRLLMVLKEDLDARLSSSVVSLEGRWSDLCFDEEGIDQALEELHRQSLHHLEAEMDE